MAARDTSRNISIIFVVAANAKLSPKLTTRKAMTIDDLFMIH